MFEQTNRPFERIWLVLLQFREKKLGFHQPSMLGSKAGLISNPTSSGKGHDRKCVPTCKRVLNQLNAISFTGSCTSSPPPPLLLYSRSWNRGERRRGERGREREVNQHSEDICLHSPFHHTDAWSWWTSSCNSFQYHRSANVDKISHSFQIWPRDSCTPVSVTFRQWWVVILMINTTILTPNTALYTDQRPASIWSLPAAFIRVNFFLTHWACIPSCGILVAFKLEVNSWGLAISHVDLTIEVCEAVV